MVVETAAVIGLTVIAKVLIAVGSIGGALVGAAIGAGVTIYMNKDQGGKEPTTEEYLDREFQRTIYLGEVVEQTEKATAQLNSSVNQQTEQFNNALKLLKKSIAEVEGESLSFQELMPQLEKMIAARKEKLGHLSEEFRTNQQNFPPSKELTQHQEVLANRCQELVETIRLLKATIQGLKTTHAKLIRLEEKIKKLEVEEKGINHRREQNTGRKSEIHQSIETLSLNLKKVLEANQKLKVANQNYEKTIALLRAHISNLTDSSLDEPSRYSIQ